MPGTPTTRDYTHERELALATTLDLYREDVFADLVSGNGTEAADKALRETATTVFRWLTGPAIMFLAVGSVVSQDTGQPVENPLGGNPMQIRSNEQFTATVTLADSRGNVIGDAPGVEDDVAWSVSGDEGVLTFTVSEDSRTATVKATGPVGSAVLRAEVGELFATLAVDVVPGEVALVTINASEPTEQPAEPEVPAQG